MEEGAGKGGKGWRGINRRRQENKGTFMESHN